MARRSLVDSFLSRYGYERVTGGAATTSRTFDTSDTADVPFGIKQWDRTLGNYDVEKLNKAMWQAYRTNGLIWRLVELTVMMIVGNKAELKANGLESDDPAEKAAGEKLQKVLDGFWKSPVNNWPALLPDIARDLLNFGEVIVLPFVDTFTGDVEMGFLPPEAVKRLRRHPLNIRRVTALVIEQDGKEIDLPLIAVDRAGVSQQHPMLAEIYTNTRSTKGLRTGRAMFWAVNRALTSVRGHGDFLQAIRPAKDAVKIVKSISDRTHINNRVVADITFPIGWTQQRINNAMNRSHKDYINPPSVDGEGAQIFGHTTDIAFKFVQTEIPGSENESTLKMIKAQFCGSTPYPEHWIFGQMDSGGLARGFEQTDPAYAFLTGRQTTITECATEAINFAIDQKLIFTSELAGLTDKQMRDFTIVLPSVDTEDVGKQIETAAKKLDGIMAARTNGDVDPDQAGEMVRDVLSKEMGLRVPKISAASQATMKDKAMAPGGQMPMPPQMEARMRQMIDEAMGGTAGK